jgi:alkylhydroperoxidase family enzyme
MERMSNQYFLYGRFLSNAETAEAIDRVSVDSVIEVARRINSSSRTMAVWKVRRDRGSHKGL